MGLDRTQWSPVEMEQAFSVVTHPQALVAAGGLVVLITALTIELTLLARLTLQRSAEPKPNALSPASPESFDWMYE